MHGAIACTALALSVLSLFFSTPAYRYAWFCGIIAASSAALVITGLSPVNTSAFAIASCAGALIFFLPPAERPAGSGMLPIIAATAIIFAVTAGVIRILGHLDKAPGRQFSAGSAAALAVIAALFCFAGFLAILRRERDNG